MKSIRIVPFVAGVAVMATAAFAQDAARMEHVVGSYVAAKRFMGTALVARGSDVILSKGFGSANLEWDIPNSPATKFRLGSLTKSQTAFFLKVVDAQIDFAKDAGGAVTHLVLHQNGRDQTAVRRK